MCSFHSPRMVWIFQIDPMRAGSAVGAMPKIQISAGPVGGTAASGTPTGNQQPLFKISVNPQSL